MAVVTKKGSFIITGAGKGLGRALCEKALSEGHSVAAISRTKSDLIQLKKDLENSSVSSRAGQKISIHPLSLTDQSTVERTISSIRKEHGEIRALVNNAGTWTGSSSARKLRKKDVEYSLDENFYSAFHPTQALLQKKARKGFANLSIVFVGATSSREGFAAVTSFCLGKGAMRTYAQSLARELGPEGIHVSHVVIDGLLDNSRTRGLNPKLGADRFMKMSAVAESIYQVAMQEKSAWTFEWDLRPFNENW